MNTPTPTLRCRAVVWLLTAFSSLASLHAAERKPNFLFIFTDDHRWDAMGVVQREQGEQTLALRGVAPHPDARALPAPFRQGPRCG